MIFIYDNNIGYLFRYVLRDNDIGYAIVLKSNTILEYITIFKKYACKKYGTFLFNFIKQFMWEKGFKKLSGETFTFQHIFKKWNVNFINNTHFEIVLSNVKMQNNIIQTDNIDKKINKIDTEMGNVVNDMLKTHMVSCIRVKILLNGENYTDYNYNNIFFNISPIEIYFVDDIEYMMQKYNYINLVEISNIHKSHFLHSINYKLGNDIGILMNKDS